MGNTLKAYVNDRIKAFCITYIQVSHDDVIVLTGNDDDFKLLKQTLIAEGYRWCQRRAFEHFLREEIKC
jgi:hypothetical protein